MLSALLARQLGKPSGPAGWLVGRIMNRLNEIMTLRSIELLDVQPRDKVLEVGFGGGVSLGLLLDRISAGVLVGLESSKTMLSGAARHYRHAIERSRLSLVQGQVERMNLPSRTYDRVCSINTLYFWSDLLLGVREIWRVLKPGGILVLSFRPDRQLAQLKFTRSGFKLYSLETVLTVLRKSGFEILVTEIHNDGHLDYVCILAKKSNKGESVYFSRPAVW